ncbi:hypothetical protein NPIL_513551 [Nephila pilipes]|uniref:Uncharacterized protein n=1 Tax=Nephila pilipes TaxID=299642 RepID=A0A8X6MY07_NEPPI|nr:hypothetical protein NPIL_513551 [Nephila pilipes]
MGHLGKERYSPSASSAASLAVRILSLSFISLRVSQVSLSWVRLGDEGLELLHSISVAIIRLSRSGVVSVNRKEVNHLRTIALKSATWAIESLYASYAQRGKYVRSRRNLIHQ